MAAPCQAVPTAPTHSASPHSEVRVPQLCSRHARAPHVAAAAATRELRPPSRLRCRPRVARALRLPLRCARRGVQAAAPRVSSPPRRGCTPAATSTWRVPGCELGQVPSTGRIAACGASAAPPAPQTARQPRQAHCQARALPAGALQAGPITTAPPPPVPHQRDWRSTGVGCLRPRFCRACELHWKTTHRSYAPLAPSV